MGTLLSTVDVELRLLVRAAAAEVVYRLYRASRYTSGEWRTVNGRSALVSDRCSFWNDDYVRQLVDEQGVRATRTLLAEAMVTVPEFGDVPVCVTIGNKEGDYETLLFTTPNIIYGPAT